MLDIRKKTVYKSQQILFIKEGLILKVAFLMGIGRACQTDELDWWWLRWSSKVFTFQRTSWWLVTILDSNLQNSTDSPCISPKIVLSEIGNLRVESYGIHFFSTT